MKLICAVTFESVPDSCSHDRPEQSYLIFSTRLIRYSYACVGEMRTLLRKRKFTSTSNSRPFDRRGPVAERGHRMLVLCELRPPRRIISISFSFGYELLLLDLLWNKPVRVKWKGETELLTHQFNWQWDNPEGREATFTPFYNCVTKSGTRIYKRKKRIAILRQFDISATCKDCLHWKIFPNDFRQLEYIKEVPYILHVLKYYISKFVFETEF